MLTMPIIRDNETYLTTPEACKFLGVSRQTISQLVQRGRLHRHKQGVTKTVYYRQSELERIAEIQQVDEPEK